MKYDGTIVVCAAYRPISTHVEAALALESMYLLVGPEMTKLITKAARTVLSGRAEIPHGRTRGGGRARVFRVAQGASGTR